MAAKGSSTAKVVPLGPLEAKSLASPVSPSAGRLATALGLAVRYYLGSARDATGWPYPKFLDLEAAPEGGVDVALDRRSWEDISREADRQDVDPLRLVAHAVLFFAAARDAGRLTGEIADSFARISDAEAS